MPDVLHPYSPVGSIRYKVVTDSDGKRRLEVQFKLSNAKSVGLDVTAVVKELRKALEDFESKPQTA